MIVIHLRRSLHQSVLGVDKLNTYIVRSKLKDLHGDIANAS